MIYIIKVWKFLTGYVIIKINGFNINKFINKAVENKIEITNIENHNNGKFYYGCVHISQLSHLNELAAKNNCNICIMTKNIADVILNNIKFKLIFFLGIIFYVCALYVCSSIIWIIDIEGNVNIEDNDILKFCYNNNISPGVLIDTLDGKFISEGLKNNFKDISWVNVSVEGTRVRIKLSEGTSKIPEAFDTVPCDIVSNIDGIISDIVTDKGTPMVKVNDVVVSGDVLISGILKNAGNEEIEINDTIHSKGTVKAYVTRNYNFSVPLITQKKIYTGNTINKYRIKLWNMDFADSKPVKYAKYDYSKSVNQLKINEKTPLPITFYKYMYKEYNIEDEHISENEAKAIANKNVLSYILNNYPVSADIISCNIKSKKEKNFISFNAEIISNEEIGVNQNIELSGGNLFNDTTESTNSE